MTLTALVRKSRCAFVNGLLGGAGVAAASGPSFGVRGASGAAPLFERALEFALETVEEALRDADMYRIGRTFRTRLGAKKSRTGRRHAARRDIVIPRRLAANSKKDISLELSFHKLCKVFTINDNLIYVGIESFIIAVYDEINRKGASKV
jgi:hypothetical protein